MCIVKSAIQKKKKITQISDAIKCKKATLAALFAKKLLAVFLTQGTG